MQEEGRRSAARLWFDREDSGVARDLWAVYAAFYDEAWQNSIEAVRAAAELHEAFERVPESAFAAQRERSREALGTGFLRGEWGPYEAFVRDQARFYAAVGWTFPAWQVITTSITETLVPRIREAYRAEPERREAVRDALSRFLTSATVVLATAYIEAKEAAIRQGERNLATMLDSIGDGVVAADAAGILVRMNPAAERLLGRTNAACAGQLLETCVSFADARTRGPRACPFSRVLREGTPVALEPHTLLVPAQAPAFAAEGTAAPIRDQRGAVTGLVFVFRDVTDVRRARERIEASERELRALARKLQGAREEERSRISREIHDELGGQLTGLKFDLGLLLRHASDGDGRLGERLRAMDELIDATVDTIRRLATELRPRLLDDLGLEDALEWQARRFEERTRVVVDVALPDPPVQADDLQRTTLFRAFQELLTNIARHARATHVTVRLSQTAEELVLEVHDDGVGFPGPEPAGTGALGLAGIRERAALLGGTFDIGGEVGRGTDAVVRLPRRPR